MDSNTLRNKTRQKDVEIIACDPAFQGYFRIDQYKVRYQLFEGGWSQTFHREVFERGQVAAVLPYDPVLDKVVLIEQFRIGALKDERSPWLLEIVAGVIQDDETPEDLSYREAREEADIELLSLMPICHYWVSPGGCTEGVHLFCGRVDASQANGVHGLPEEGEDIRVHVYDAKDAFEMVRDGTINNALGIIALQWLELNRGKIFKTSQ